jgi:hypothetical protein
MSKLFGAVLLAVLGWYAADAVGGHLPPEQKQGLLRPVSAFFGLTTGWRFMGPRMGDGIRAGIGMGLSAVVVLVLICMTVFAGAEMTRRAMRMTYGGDPFEALQDMVQIALDNVLYLNHADVIVTLLVGGMIVGFITELISHRWS